MGYEQREPVALCDGCGKGLWDECYGLRVDGGDFDDDGRDIYVFKMDLELMKENHVHYCRITPCLERAVVNELRKIHGVYNDEPKTPEDSSEPVEAV